MRTVSSVTGVMLMSSKSTSTVSPETTWTGTVAVARGNPLGPMAVIVTEAALASTGSMVMDGAKSAVLV